MAAVKAFIPRIRNIPLVKGLRGPGPAGGAWTTAGRALATKKGDEQHEKSVKEKILESSLAFVASRGWTSAAISDGAVSLGYPGISHGMFPNPSAELINYFNAKCNRTLSESLKEFLATADGPPDVRKFIEDALKMRLKMIIPYIHNWPQALAIMSSPRNAPLAFSTFSLLVDDICYLSGDKSVDINWYSRRAAIALIYKTTELCMIQDHSEEFKYTWEFLNRRITEAFTIDEILQNNKKIANNLVDAAVASFITMRNILGLDFSPR